MTIVGQRLTLEEFLKVPEVKPALEYEVGMVTQKVSPQGQHSVLQVEVAEIFNRQVRPNKVARALTELRTSFAGASPFPTWRSTVGSASRVPQTAK
ncbi:MAG TPA: hypothetical protein VHL09_09240 [Dehalococcoidia bacterium]|nr:hypothetical protein [Dehalococcoidia bacterium]